MVLMFVRVDNVCCLLGERLFGMVWMLLGLNNLVLIDLRNNLSFGKWEMGVF